MIRICGLGVNPPAETTLETLQVLGACRVVYCDLADQKTFGWLKDYCRKVERPKSAAQVVAAAKIKGDVGLAVWGHPQFSSELARQVQLQSRKAKIPYQVIGAISPIGSAFARSVSFLGGDYGYQGIQAYELETLLADSKVLTTRLPLVVYAESAPRARWKKLFELLRERYPKDQEVRLYPVGGRERIALAARIDGAALDGGVVLVPAPIAPAIGREERARL
ncbi:MAG: hypothetical protein HY077_16720 [Elusimicrobia bacterium]|nr:hypothetical protein [Elusimicrobiota bacterium]